MSAHNCIAEDVLLGTDVRLSKFINLYGCSIGDGTRIGAFVEVQKNAAIGRNCKISSHSFICEGVTIEDDVFLGHGVTFTNDRYPRSTAADGRPQTESDWTVERTIVKRGASIGSGATILPNLTIGENAIVGAGSVVTRDVPADTIVAGNPARITRILKVERDAPDKDMSATSAPVPFLDLVTPHLQLEEELIQVLRDSLHTAAFVGGAPVEKFELAFAEFCTTAHAIGVSSGTDALRFALMSCGVMPGDVVLTVPNTFIATTEAISQAGATPEFIDIDEHTCNMSTDCLQTFLETQCYRDSARKLVSLRSGRPVTAIVPVHLYGQMADVDPILCLAQRFGLIVIEDACQAHGAEYFSAKHDRWMKAGSMGSAAAFSFYPGKNLGACGEGGAVTTNDAAVAARIRLLRDHGQAKKYHHDIEGYNGRLDALQAGFLLAKLPHLREWNAQRRVRAAKYHHLLADTACVILPHELAWSQSVYHLFVIRTPDRDGLAEHLKQAGIATAIHYPIPLHLQPAYAELNYGPRSFPVAELVSSQILSLPMFPHLTSAQQVRVVAEIHCFLVARSLRSQETCGVEAR